MSKIGTGIVIGTGIALETQRASGGMTRLHECETGAMPVAVAPMISRRCKAPATYFVGKPASTMITIADDLDLRSANGTTSRHYF